MANIKSAIKRIKVTKRNNSQNKIYLSTVKTYTKKYLATLKDLEQAPTEENRIKAFESLGLVFSKLDKAVKRSVLHPNTAARKKANLHRAWNASILNN